MTPDEIRSMRHPGAPVFGDDLLCLAAELCARLDALVAVGERIAKAMEFLVLDAASMRGELQALELIARRMPWRANGDTEP